MIKNKTYIILIAIILVFFIVMFALFGVDNLRKERYETTLLVGDNTIWAYKKKQWINYSNSTSTQDFDWQKYKVFSNNEEVGNYFLWHDDKWYAFDDKKNAINIDGNILAYKSNHKISMYKFTEKNIDDYTVVNEVLEDNGLELTKDFTSSYMISFDYDGDGEEEDFYLVTNVFPIGFDPDTIFALVFMVDGEKVYPIYTDISNNTGYNGCKPYFNAFLDLDNDKKYEFVLSCSKYSVSGGIDMLYQFKDKEFKIVISSE